jgi:hypothetical protein
MSQNAYAVTCYFYTVTQIADSGEIFVERTDQSSRKLGSAIVEGGGGVQVERTASHGFSVGRLCCASEDNQDRENVKWKGVEEHFNGGRKNIAC